MVDFSQEVKNNLTLFFRCGAIGNKLGRYLDGMNSNLSVLRCTNDVVDDGLVWVDLSPAFKRGPTKIIHVFT